MNWFKRLRLKFEIRSQNCWIYCPKCTNELISSQSFVSDEEVVTYKCTKCGEVSRWDFDTFPVPVLTT